MVIYFVTEFCDLFCHLAIGRLWNVAKSFVSSMKFLQKLLNLHPCIWNPAKWYRKVFLYILQCQFRLAKMIRSCDCWMITCQSSCVVRSAVLLLNADVTVLRCYQRTDAIFEQRNIFFKLISRSYFIFGRAKNNFTLTSNNSLAILSFKKQFSGSEATTVWQTKQLMWEPTNVQKQQQFADANSQNGLSILQV